MASKSGSTGKASPSHGGKPPPVECGSSPLPTDNPKWQMRERLPGRGPDVVMLTYGWDVKTPQYEQLKKALDIIVHGGKIKSAEDMDSETVTGHPWLQVWP